MTQPMSKTMAVKTYTVLQKNNLARPGEPNERIVGVRLTRRTAQDIVDANPGTRIEKHIATK